MPIFTRPADIARIFNLDGTLLAGGSAQSPLVDFAGDRSLMKLDGAAHREHREILRKAFRPAGLPDGGEHALEQIRQAVGNWPLGKRFNLGMAVDQLALGLVSDLALGRAPHELLVAAAAALEGLRRQAQPAGLLRRALAPPAHSPFHALRCAAEPYLESRLKQDRPHSSATSSCIFARMAAARSRRGTQLDRDDVRDEMMTVLVAMTAALSCGVKHAIYWILRSPGTQDRLRACPRERAAFPSAPEIRAGPFWTPCARKSSVFARIFRLPSGKHPPPSRSTDGRCPRRRRSASAFTSRTGVLTPSLTPICSGPIDS